MWIATLLNDKKHRKSFRCSNRYGAYRGGNIRLYTKYFSPYMNPNSEISIPRSNAHLFRTTLFFQISFVSKV